MVDEFLVQLGQSVQPTRNDAAVTQKNSQKSGETSFSEILNQVQDVRFSNHAQKRLESRQINLDAESVSRLSEAVDRVEKKGSQSSLVLMDDVAFLVNVPQRLVVTAVDAANRGEGVFTQIDSVVLAEPSRSENKSNLNIKA